MRINLPVGVVHGARYAHKSRHESLSLHVQFAYNRRDFSLVDCAFRFN
jgi:hypothetical protein